METFKCIKILKHENDTLHNVLNRTFEGYDRLRLLVNGWKNQYEKRNLGFNGNNTHSTCKVKTDYFIKPKEKIYNHAPILEKRKINKIIKAGHARMRLILKL